MNDLKINQEFQNILPFLSAEEYSALETDIVNSGRILHPILVWNGYIIDGHNRYKICREHEIAFETSEMQFQSEDEAKLWIIQHQMGRRNLSTYARGTLALKMKDPLTELAQKRRWGGVPLNSAEGGDVRDQIAHLAGIGHDTLSKIEEIEAAAPDEIKKKVLSGKMSINAAHKSLKSLADKPANSTSKPEIEQPKEFPNKKIIRFIELWEDINANLDILTDGQKERLAQVSEELIMAIQLEGVDEEVVHE